MKPFVESNDLIDSADALRERAENDGYLFFRGLIDPKTVLDLRRKFAEICYRHGWLEPDSDPIDAIRGSEPHGPFMEGDQDFWPVLDEFQSLESFHAFAHYPTIIEMLDHVFGETTLVHPRNIGRIMFPQNVKFTTPAHQDHIHIRGTEDTYTAWMPLGDCPMKLGGLAILSGSHKLGLQPTQSAYGAGGRGIDTSDLDFDWVASDFQIGDALFFHSLTIHKALPNLTEDQMRFSVDYRYQPISHPLMFHSLLPHFNRMSWEQIYENWQSKKYQYYWEDFDLKILE